MPTHNSESRIWIHVVRVRNPVSTEDHAQLCLLSDDITSIASETFAT